MSAPARLAMLNERLRRADAALHLTMRDAHITVHDATLLGISFGLPLGLVDSEVVRAAVAGARARRAFICGDLGAKKAA